MHFGPAEVNHQPVAEIFGDVAAKTCHRRCRGALIPGGDIAPVFRIEMGCDLRGVDQVAEQKCEMTPLTVQCSAC